MLTVIATVGRWVAFWGWVSCVCLGYWISYVRFCDHWILCANLLLWFFSGMLGWAALWDTWSQVRYCDCWISPCEYSSLGLLCGILDLRCGILWTLDSGCESSALGLPCEIIGLLWDHLGGSTCLKWWHSDQRISWHIERGSSYADQWPLHAAHDMLLLFTLLMVRKPIWIKGSHWFSCI